MNRIIFDLIDKFAGYGFNKSHSAAYALISYQTAFLKANYPVEFMATLLTIERTKPESVVKLISECRNMSIPVLPPDINDSDPIFTTHEGSIRFGLNAIKNVGTAALESILQARKKCVRFENLLDVFAQIDTSKVNSRVLEALVKSGAFDSLEPNRKKILEGIDRILSLAQAEKSMHRENQVSFFDLLSEEEEEEGRRFQNRESVNLAGVVAANVVRLTKKNNEKWSILTLEDLWGTIDVMVFSKVFETARAILNPEEFDDPIFVAGYLNTNDESVKVVARSITTLTAIRAERSASVSIDLPADVAPEELESIKNLIHHPGNCSVSLSLVTENACRVRIGLREKIKADEQLVADLEEIVPLESLAFQLSHKNLSISPRKIATGKLGSQV